MSKVIIALVWVLGWVALIIAGERTSQLLLTFAGVVVLFAPLVVFGISQLSNKNS